jgi:hypothetical protein
MASTSTTAGKGSGNQSQTTPSHKHPAKSAADAIGDFTKKVTDIVTSDRKLLLNTGIRSAMEDMRSKPFKALKDLAHAKFKKDPNAKADLYVRPYRQQLSKAKAVFDLIPSPPMACTIERPDERARVAAKAKEYAEAGRLYAVADGTINRWEQAIIIAYQTKAEARK